jgi:glycosyltransferase involved in cell wall biosynthesis
MKKVSVIIPVYNAMTSGGGYIHRCVDSVLKQKKFPTEDIEIVLINDGSGDNSLEELQKIKKRNPKVVRLINQENMGVAKTRNKGVRLATGEYITFIDQDDWIDDDFLATLYAIANKTNAEVVASGYRRPNKQGNMVRVFHLADKAYSRYTLSVAWAKLHRTDFIRDNGIEFFNNGYGEDLPFSVRENAMAHNYQSVDYIGYNWFLNERSVSNTSQKELTEDTVESIKKLLSKLCDITPVQNERNYYYFLLRTMVFYLLFSGRKAYQGDFISAKWQFFDIIKNKNELFMRKNLHRLLIPPKGEVLSVGLVVSGFIVLEKLHLISFFAIFWCKKPKS